MVKVEKSDHISASVETAAKRISVTSNPKILDETEDENAENLSERILTTETSAPNIIQTLPNSFNSMINELINIETDNAKKLIEMLGNKLGINDYQMNMASFWLLDAIAFEILRLRDKINPKNLAVIVSWITGEAKLIQEKRYEREEFFKEINRVFLMVSNELNKGRPLMYWEEVIDWINSFEKNEQKLNEEETVFNESIKSHISKNSLEDENVDETILTSGDAAEEERSLSNFSGKAHLMSESSMDVLDALMESTYRMYANSFHYVTVHAAFTRPIIIHSHRLPYNLRFPRPVRLYVSPIVQLRAISKKGTGSKTRKSKNDSKPSADIPPPPPSIVDEEITVQKKSEILPLMESNEASFLLEQYAASQKGDVINGGKKTVKKKRKA